MQKTTLYDPEKVTLTETEISGCPNRGVIGVASGQEVPFLG